MKVCVSNGENTNHHKLQYFPNSLRGETTNWFGRFQIVHLASTWAKVQRAFIIGFSEI